MPWVQQQPPELYPFASLREHSKIPHNDFCPHLAACACSPVDSDVLFVACTGKIGHIVLVVLESGCLVLKNNIEIAYALKYKITAISMESVEESAETRLARGVYLTLGFEDGTVIMYLLRDNNSQQPLQRVFAAKVNLPKPQIVINTKIHRSDMLVMTAYSLFVLPQALLKSTQSTPNKQQPPHPQQRIALPICQCKLDFSMDQHSSHLYIYNQLEGVIVLDLTTRQQIRHYEHCVKSLSCCSRLLPSECSVMAIGSSSEGCVKFVDEQAGRVANFHGFKNYVSCFEEDVERGVLWAGALDGSVGCFSWVALGEGQGRDKQKQYQIENLQLRYVRKITEEGIRKIMVQKNTLIVFDCDHNVLMFDIVMPPLTTDHPVSFSNDRQTHDFPRTAA